MTTTVAVVGATGTMGTLISRLIDESPDFDVVASLSSASALREMESAELVVDFTHPAVSRGVVEHAVDAGLNVLVGTSGWSADRIASLTRRLESTPDVGVVIIPNFSVGSALVTAFSAMAARFYDSIEIVEAHHVAKVDSPSGTAVRTAELIGVAREALGPVAAPHTDQRARGQQVSSVPIHSLRMRGVLARQEVIFGGSGELVTFSHETTSAQSYEAGLLLGLAAARDARGVLVGLETIIDLMPGNRADQNGADQ
jgi:4-hydroxy-tetrahydrodipicolinate reductase